MTDQAAPDKCSGAVVYYKEMMREGHKKERRKNCEDYRLIY